SAPLAVRGRHPKAAGIARPLAPVGAPVDSVQWTRDPRDWMQRGRGPRAMTRNKGLSFTFRSVRALLRSHLSSYEGFNLQTNVSVGSRTQIRPASCGQEGSS